MELLDTSRIIAKFSARLVGFHYSPAHIYKTPYQCGKHYEIIYDCQICRGNSRHCNYVYKCDVSKKTLCIKHFLMHLSFMKHCTYRYRLCIVQTSRLLENEYSNHMGLIPLLAATSNVTIQRGIISEKYNEIIASYLKCNAISELCRYAYKL